MLKTAEKGEGGGRKSEVVPRLTRETSSLKVKRFLASKMSEFKSGRRVIHRFTGNIGIHIMDALYSCFFKFSNTRVAQAMQVNVYKVATKTAVFIHEKIITEEMMRTCKESNMLLLFCLIEQLQTPLRLRQTEVILSLTTDCFHSIRALLEPLPGSSFDRLETLYSFATTGGFIEFFLSSPDIELERIVIQSNLHNIMTPYEQDAKQLTIYLKDQLLLRRRELLYLMNKPSLLHFLRKQDTFQLVQEWLQETYPPEEGINWLLLYSDIKGYISVTSHHLLPHRAQYILNKYLLQYSSPSSPTPVAPLASSPNQADPIPSPPPASPSSTSPASLKLSSLNQPTTTSLSSSLSSSHPLKPPPPVEEMEVIMSHLGNDSFPKTLFNPLLQLIVNHLTPYFENDFLSSQFYQRLESELELIDMKIIAFFHEDPNGIFSVNDKEDREEMISMIYNGVNSNSGTSGNNNTDKESSSGNQTGKPSMFERLSFWHQGG